MVFAHDMLPSGCILSPREKPPPLGMSPDRPSVQVHCLARSSTLMPAAWSWSRILSASSKSRDIFALLRSSISERISRSLSGSLAPPPPLLLPPPPPP